MLFDSEPEELQCSLGSVGSQLEVATASKERNDLMGSGSTLALFSVVSSRDFR